MKHKLNRILACLLLLGFYARAQETKQLSLNEAIELSIKNSKVLKVNQYKVEEAVAVVKEAKERSYPMQVYLVLT